MSRPNTKTREKSAYLRIYERIRNDITNGAYLYGTKLPSKRLMAEETGVSVITVEHAYTLLCDEGYIEAIERSGYFVIYRQSDFFALDYTEEKKNIEPHSAGEFKSEFPFSVMAKAMRKVLNDYGESILEKESNKGCPELRREISKYLARSRGIMATPSQIVIGSGAEYLYGMIVTLLGRSRVYAIEKPSYRKIEMVYSINGVELDNLPLVGGGIDSRSLSETKASVLHITPYRSYPSGVTATATKRKEYLYWCSLGDRYIIEDDFESEFTPAKKPEETVYSLGNGKNVFYLNTFSKTVSPALRVGYMVLPNDFIELFDKKMSFYTCPVSAFEQLVLAELISNGSFERHINRVRRQKRKLQ
ncbi:MAG: PLP-dependent aminotransferase family protein [Ruminococcaceae bacterium]|nr:PLP-dependent aminotransferase family protein [Oscillospiraceae bacterium]